MPSRSNLLPLGRPLRLRSGGRGRGPARKRGEGEVGSRPHKAHTPVAANPPSLSRRFATGPFLPRYAAERRSERRGGGGHLAIIRSALGGRYLLVKILSGAGAAGRPKASATSLTERAKRSGSTSPMPFAFTYGVRMLVCSEICRRSVSSRSEE